MFKKKECNKCKSKISDKYDFCPYCGNSIGEADSKEWGMLGKNDVKEAERIQNPLFGRITEGMLNKMLGSAMKMLEKEMQKEMNPQKEGMPKTNVRLMINGKEISLNNIEKKQEEIKEPKVRQNLFSKEKVKEFSSLPREEAKTNIRRLSNTVVYELEMPGVESIEDISVVRLESSIEIKAIGKKKAYFKLIPINLPLKKYDLVDGKLILELGIK